MAEERFQRRLAAILAADVVGYSHLMGQDETGTLAALKALRAEVVDPQVAGHKGRVFKTTGDGVLAEFPSVVNAVACAVDVQRAMVARNTDLPDNRVVRLRIGINLGDVIAEGEDIFGDGVNVAARLENIAPAGGIAVSGTVRDHLGNRLDLQFEEIGAQSLKNIDRPVLVYLVHSSNAPAFSRPALPVPDNPSIVVLPFDNISSDPDQTHFADGIVEEITAALGRIRSFFVIARNSAFAYKGKRIDLQQVGRELGVRYALEGSVRRAGNHIRITAQLIETATAHHIWADRFDGDVADFFDLQDDITARVVGAIQPSIQIAEIERARRKRPDDLKAYDLVMQALPHVWALERKENSIAVSLLERALEIDSDYPLALSLLAWCYGQRSVYNWSELPEDDKLRALKLAERAADLSSEDPFVLAALAAAHSFFGNLGTANLLLERARRLDPSSAFAWNRSAWLSAFRGEPEISIKQFEMALRLSPFDPMNFNCYFGMGLAHFAAHRPEQSIEFISRGLAERPHATWIYRLLIPALVEVGRLAEARERMSVLKRDYPNLTIRAVREALAFYAQGINLDRYAAGLRQAGLPE